MKRLLLLIALLLSLSRPVIASPPDREPSLFLRTVLAQLSSRTAGRLISYGGPPTTCSVGDVFADVSVSPAIPYFCGTPNVWTALGAGSGANTTLSNLGVTAINAHLLFNADNSWDVGSSTNAVRTLYYYTLVGKGATTAFEGPVSACTTAAASNGRLHFTSVGPSWSYNTGACQLLFLANSTNTLGASGTIDMSPVTSADALRIPNKAGCTPTAIGALCNDTTQKTTVGFANGAVGAYPRVLSMQNCTTGATCASTNEVDADAGQQGTTETNYALNWSMPANFLFTSKAIQVCGVFELTTTGSAPTLVIRLKAGSTVLVANSAYNAMNSMTSRGFSYCWQVQGTAAAGASVSVEAGYNGGTTNFGSSNFLNATDQPVAGLATNGALTIQISAQWGTATTGNTVQLHQLTVMELN